MSTGTDVETYECHTHQYIGVTAGPEHCLAVDIQTLFARGVVCGDTAADIVTVSYAAIITGPYLQCESSPFH
jgi:hypothetical protein